MRNFAYCWIVIAIVNDNKLNTITLLHISIIIEIVIEMLFVCKLHYIQIHIIIHVETVGRKSSASAFPTTTIHATIATWAYRVRLSVHY